MTIYGTAPSCERCYETPWGDACKSCRSGNYSKEPNDEFAKCWEMAAEYLKLKHDMRMALK